MKNVFDVLVGKTIIMVAASLDLELMEFYDVSGDVFRLSTVIDCCNSVWFNHVSGLDCLIKSTVVEVRQSQWNEVARTEQEDDEACFWTFITTHGYFDLEVRNSSNGYYGGNVNLVSIGKSMDHNLIKIEEDF